MVYMWQKDRLRRLIDGQYSESLPRDWGGHPERFCTSNPGAVFCFMEPLVEASLVFLSVRGIICFAVLRKSAPALFLSKKFPALPSPLATVMNHGYLVSLGLLVPVVCCAIHSAMQVRRARGPGARE